MVNEVHEERHVGTLAYATDARSLWMRLAWVVCLQIAAASVLRELMLGLTSLNDFVAGQPPVSMTPGRWVMRMLWGPTVIPGALLGVMGYRSARWVLPLGIAAFIANAIVLDVWVEISIYVENFTSRPGGAAWPYLLAVAQRHLVTIFLGAVITWIVTRPAAFEANAVAKPGSTNTLLWLAVGYLIASGIVGSIVTVGFMRMDRTLWAYLIDELLMVAAGVCLAIRSRRWLGVTVASLVLAAMVPLVRQGHWAITYSGGIHGILPVAYLIRAINILQVPLEGCAPYVFLIWFLTRGEVRNAWLPATRE